jgi:insulin gene enhancer protein ISL-1
MFRDILLDPVIPDLVILVCRLFGTKCDKCGLSFSRNDFVMRAKTKIYHIECFRCSACERQLIPGDEFALREDGLFCKEDHEVLEKATNSENNNNTTNVNNNNSSHNNNNNEGSNSGTTKLALTFHSFCT